MHNNGCVFGCALFVQEQAISSYVKKQVKLKRIGLKLDAAMKNKPSSMTKNHVGIKGGGKSS
jgi:hypothetical protein